MFFSVWVMVLFDSKSVKGLKLDILDNTYIKNIVYINKYDNYYLVMDDNYLYLFDLEYNELNKINRNELFNNKYDYDIIYKDGKIMYMDNYIDKKGVIFKYYDIYTNELIKEITF